MSQNQNKTTGGEDEPKQQMADALHVTWAFSSKAFKGFKPSKIQVLDDRDRGYHTSYDTFMQNMVDYIAKRDRLIEARAALDSLNRFSSLHNDHRNMWYLSKTGELISIAQAKAELEAKIKELEGE